MIDLESYAKGTESRGNRPKMTTIDTPFPDGSMFRVKLHCVDSEYCPADCKDGCITESRSGLRSLHLAVEIIYGPHSGMGWYDSIILPEESQRIDLSQGQRKACAIGAQMLVALLVASGKPLKLSTWRVFDGIEACVSVRRNTYNGNVRQAIAGVLASDNPLIAKIQSQGEVIAEDTAKAKSSTWQSTPSVPRETERVVSLVEGTLGGVVQPPQWGSANPSGGGAQNAPNPATAWSRAPSDDVIPF